MYGRRKRPINDEDRATLILQSIGYSGPETAAALGMTYAGFRSHVDRLYARLGVSNMPSAVAVALARRIIDNPYYADGKISRQTHAMVAGFVQLQHRIKINA